MSTTGGMGGVILALCGALALLGGAPAEATSVKRLTLSELVAEADAIVRVKVVGRHTAWGQHLEREAIVTEHRFEPLGAPLRGEPLDSLTLFGGQVGELRQTLEGQPELPLGSEWILLVIQREPVQCPLVGVWKGAFEVRKGQCFRAGRPVVDVVEDRVVLGEDNERGMSPAALWGELQARVKAAGGAR